MLKSDLDPATRLATMFDFDRVLGLNLQNTGTGLEIPDEIQALVDARQRARQEKQWALSDQLRDQIQERGYRVQDTPQGIKVFKL
jgi:cysteinyl-tRNA synthetase